MRTGRSREKYTGVNVCRRCRGPFAVVSPRESVCGRCQGPPLHRHGWSGDYTCASCGLVALTTDETQRQCPDCWEAFCKWLAGVIDPKRALPIWEALAQLYGEDA